MSFVVERNVIDRHLQHKLTVGPELLGWVNADEPNSGRLTMWTPVLGKAKKEELIEAEKALGKANGGRVVEAEVKYCRTVE